MNTLTITGPGFSSLNMAKVSAEAQKELPQVRRASAEDARFRINKNNTMRPVIAIDVLTRSTEKNDDDMMNHEQIDGYMKLDVQENIVSGSEIVDLKRYNASKPENVQNKSKEYINGTKKG